MDRERGHDEYFQLPASSWDQIDADVLADLAELSKTMAPLARAEGADVKPLPSPAELGFRLAALGTRLMAAVARDEADVRQVITTLRTALTVCWDMYGIEEASRTTVREHMDRLKAGIESFEADLVQLRDKRTLHEEGDA